MTWQALRAQPLIAPDALTLGALAALLAAFVALDMSNGSEVASILAAAALVYLGAAALQKPSTAWSLFLGTLVTDLSRMTNVNVPRWIANWIAKTSSPKRKTSSQCCMKGWRF